MARSGKRRRATTDRVQSYARDSRGRRSTSSEVEEQQTPSPKRRRTAIEVVEDLKDREIQDTLGKSPTAPVAFGSYGRLRQSTLLQRYVPGRFAGNNTPSLSSDDESESTKTDSDAEEDARIERSMGVIRKKTATRGTEGGTKYHCDVCSVDVTSTVRISCAHSACPEYDLCVPCFSSGESSKNHDPRTHPYSVIEQNSVPIYAEDWGADEELLLLEGAEIYGLGSWADIADHIGGFRNKDEVRDHYIETYVNSPNFPLPERADPGDKTLSDSIPKEEFQARKKRRVEERKEAAKAAPPATPKQKPTASVPACHEVQGYMPGRLEFETEFANEAEEAVQHMQFEPGNGLNANGEMEPEMELKMTVIDIYNARLTARTERKRVIFEHNLLDYRKNAAQDKKRTKEERDLLNKVKPFARMVNREDLEDFGKGLEAEHNLRLAISQLHEWRTMGITDLKSGEKYEQEKQQRAQRAVPQGAFDRLASSRPKQAQISEPPSAASQLTTPELPLRLQRTGPPKTAPAETQPPNDFDMAFESSNINGTAAPPPAKTKYAVQPLNGVVPLELENEGAPDLHLLEKEEIELCNALRVQPKPYLVIKEHLIKEAMKQGGALKKKDARTICKIDVSKASRIYDFMVHSGWIMKA